jgi:hypothetical protein
MVSSGITSVPYLCGDMLKNMIPCFQNDQQALPVMKARVRQESSQRKVCYYSTVPVFKIKTGGFPVPSRQADKQLNILISDK